jgi:hypothetical protein
MHRVCQRTTAGGDHGPVKSAWRDASALPTGRALDGSNFVVDGADATMQRVWRFVECAAAAEVGDKGGEGLRWWLWWDGRSNGRTGVTSHWRKSLAAKARQKAA